MKPILHRQSAILLCLSMAATYSAWEASGPLAAAALVTWDGGGANNSWSTGLNWLADAPPTANDALVFDGATRTAPVNDLGLDTAIASIDFAATAASFVVSGNSITLGSSITDNSPLPQTVNLPMILTSTHTANVVAGGSLTLGAAISGAGTLTKSGDGLLQFSSAVSFVGDIVLNGGAMAFGADSTIGNLVLGASPAVPFSTTPSTLDLSIANLTVASLNVRVDSSASNSVMIGSGKTLTINGPVSIGPNTSGLATTGIVTQLIISGEGNLVVTTTGNFAVGLPRLNADTGTDPFTTVDLSNLKTFTYDAAASAGELRVGGGNVRGILLLANTTNTITAAVVHVANSAVTSGPSGNNNGGVSRLGLGAGANVINTDTLNVGGGKSAGIFDFQGGSGTLTLAGRGGNPVNITVGNQNSATGSNAVTQFALAGHSVTVNAGTMMVGRMGGATAGTGAAAVTFDTGEFNVASLQLAVNASGTAPNGAVGSFTLGTDSTSTGVLNVTSSFFLSNRTNTALLTSPANGTFTINGGTANINTDIVDASTSGDASTRITTINLAGGRLNMMGHAIGSATAPITTVAFPEIGQAATLANLGSTGVNGAGLKLSNTGTLVIDGINSYLGVTTIERGTLVLNGSIEGTSSVVIGEGVLRLGASNRIADAALLTLGNGTFATSGFSETLGAMTLAGPARLELDTGASILHFADSSAAPWTGSLSIIEWSGSPAGGGTDQLFFGSTATALTTNQLALVQFVDPFGPGSGVTGARLLPTGELVAIPEPTTMLSSLAGLGMFFLRRRPQAGPH